MKGLCVRKCLWGLLALLFVLALLTPDVRAEETTESEFHDRLMIRGGWAYVFGADVNTTFRGPRTGIGANIDFTNTLGGGSSTNAFRLDGLYRFNDRHAIGASWYRVGLSGQTALNQDIQIEDNLISAGASTQTSLSLNLYRLLYNYSFYHNDKVELAVSPGLYMVRTKFSLSAQGTINNIASNATTVSEQLTVPLPSIGLVANYNITPKLQFQSRFDFFYLAVGDYTGEMFEFYAGLEYRLFKHLAMGAAYDRLAAGLKNDSSSGYAINVSYNLAYVYATLYAF